MTEHLNLEGFQCPAVGGIGCKGKLKLEKETNTFKCPNCGIEVADYEEWIRKIDKFGRESIRRFLEKIYSPGICP